MELQPYKLTIVNKTEDELNSFPAELLQQHFGFLKTIFAPSFSVDALTDIVFATKENFEAIINSLNNIGIQGQYSIKKAQDFIFENQSLINETASPDFICLAADYICDKNTQDDVYQKVDKGEELTPADKHILDSAD